MTETSRKLAIRCRSIVKEFSQGNTKVRALRGVDLDVYAGELLLLVGPSGCGKTTLLSIMAGIMDATSGELNVLGQDIGRFSSSRKARFRSQNLGFIFQQFNLLPSLTATENVSVPLIVGGMSRSRALRLAREQIDRVELSERANAFPSQLSGGQQQRVAIARALSNNPKILVCDEPTSALDKTTGQTIMTLLRNVALEVERCVIVVTHDPRVYSYGDRIAEMSDGQVTSVTTNDGAMHTEEKS